MNRWGVAIAALALCACKKSGSEDEWHCAPTVKPSPEWAYQEHQAAGGVKVEFPKQLEIAERGDYKALYEFHYTPGPDQPNPLLGRVWKCKLYSDPRALAKVLLADEGWAAAKPDDRTKLAHKVYTMLWGSMTKPNNDWNAQTTFNPPELTALPDGGVKLVHWRSDYKIDSHMTGGKQHFIWEVVTFAPDASVGEPKIIARD